MDILYKKCFNSDKLEEKRWVFMAKSCIRQEARFLTRFGVVACEAGRIHEYSLIYHRIVCTTSVLIVLALSLWWWEKRWRGGGGGGGYQFRHTFLRPKIKRRRRLCRSKPQKLKKKSFIWERGKRNYTILTWQKVEATFRHYLWLGLSHLIWFCLSNTGAFGY